MRDHCSSLAHSAQIIAQDPDRINRLEQILSFRREFIKDLFWELGTYVSYDSRPPESANSSVDYGIVSSLGYSF